jgi:hypothetical protein
VISRIEISVIGDGRVDERTRGVTIVEDRDVDSDLRASAGPDVGGEGAEGKGHERELERERGRKSESKTRRSGGRRRLTGTERAR